MQGRKYDYIKGNTAVAPSRKPKERKYYDEKHKQIRKKNKEQALKNRRKNDRKYMFFIVAVIFSFGCITIAGDSRVYNMQKQVTDLETTISNTKEENEALKVKVLKYSSLNNIEENAASKLSMYIPQSEDVVKIDFSKDYFKDVVNTHNSKSSEKVSLFSKIISLLI